MVLPRSYFYAPATELAPLLLGKILCREVDGEVIRRRILETECYFGKEDSACHAHKGRTNRTDVMYGKGGRAYVYLCYGIHNMLNFTTGPKEHPEAVLIRGVEGAMGPGRLTKLMKIDRSLNKAILIPESGLWIEDDGIVLDFFTAKRVGIDYAKEIDREKPWRFIAKSESVAKE